MRILVTGGRNFMDKQAVYLTLDDAVKGIPKDEVIVIHGNARGADDLADQWGRDRDIQVCRCPAPWHKWPLSAGPIRNKAMLLLEPHKVVAFPGGAGTSNMIKLARQAGIEVILCVR